MTTDLIKTLRDIIGRKNIYVGTRPTRRFRKGYRFGDGEVLCAVCPGSLLEQWRVMQACVEADVVMIFQAANTGLTGGSTPFGTGYDRPIVIINGMRINRIDVIDGGCQVICLPGARLNQLEAALKPLGREPHSVIGSTTIGASVVGGICNTSGGSLVQRGPAYTELALFAQVGADGQLRLINHLGVDLGTEAETVLKRLDAGDYSEADVDLATDRAGSDRDYKHHVRDITADSPARFNADPRTLYEVSGSAGKVGVFAVRLDTFEAETETQVFYVGTNDPADLQKIRRHILSSFKTLPISAEYMHRGAYDIAQDYGKDIFLLIKKLGMKQIPRAFAIKNWFDGITERVGLGSTVSDRLIQFVTNRLPQHLPNRLNDYRDRFEHHLIVKTGGSTTAELGIYLSDLFPNENGDFLLCTPEEGQSAALNRFAIAGANIRYAAVNPHLTGGLVPLDVALPRNLEDWIEVLPPEIENKIHCKSFVGHFLCHVMHQEYLINVGEDPDAVEHEMLERLQTLGAEFPAEHNVGHLYVAKPSLSKHYQKQDPTNRFNPGVGKTSKKRSWK